MSKKSDEITLTIESRLEALNKVELLSEKVGRKMGFSDDQQDKTDAFDSGAAGYVVKPGDYETFVEAVRTIDSYWTLSELPN